MSVEEVKPEPSTPVYRMLAQCKSWQQAPSRARTRFYQAMKGKDYEFDALMDAWVWFLSGWIAVTEMALERDDDEQ